MMCGLVRGLQTHQRFITLPEKLPQFWHCTVMCSAPLSCELKAERWLAMRHRNLGWSLGRTVRSAGKEEEHVRGWYALQMRYKGAASVVVDSWIGARVAVDRAEVVRRGGAMRELAEARVL